MKHISILGSTGSIGTQTLEIIDLLEDIKVVGLSAHSNSKLLIKQINKYNPEIVAITSRKSYELIKGMFKNTKIVFGQEGLIEVATYEKINMVINSLVGNVGLIPTIEAIKAKKDIGLANKETLVTAGKLVMDLVKEHNVNIYPIDSEHSAIFQCLQGEGKSKLEKIYLTASGGPFRTWTKKEIGKAKIKDALNHPNWEMGDKITIDSATMMNKGLEVIEAKWLFDIDISKIKVLVHPQSIIHSMVEYVDGSVISQMGNPDMRIPISYALTYPNRAELPFEKIDFIKNNNLTFEEPDYDKFPCLQLAFDAIKAEGNMPAVLNAANEICVDCFLKGLISFKDIPILIEKSLFAYNLKSSTDLEGIFEADIWTRNFIKKSMR